MQKNIALFFSLFVFFMVQAQSVHFVLKLNTAIPHDSVYITGSFNNWDSTANKNYLMQQDGQDTRSITLRLPPGTIRYKFTRGNWLTVEKTNIGGEVEDRVLNVRADTTVTDKVDAWRDELIADKKLRLSRTTEDTSRLLLYSAIAGTYAFYTEFFNADSALYYAQTALQLNQKIIKSEDYKNWVPANSLRVVSLQEILASLLHSFGNYPKSLEIRLENLKAVEQQTDQILIVQAMRNITTDYESMKDYQNVLRYSKMMDSIVRKLPADDFYVKDQIWFGTNLLANAYYRIGDYDSALSYALQLKKTTHTGTFAAGYTAVTGKTLGDIYSGLGQPDSAMKYYRTATTANVAPPQTMAESLTGLAKVFQQQGQADSALYYARAAFDYLQSHRINFLSWSENTDSYIAEVSPLLASLYKANHQPDSAYKYLALSVTLRDSLYNADKIKQFQNLTFNESARQQQLEQQAKAAAQAYSSKISIYSLLGVLLIILVGAFLLYRNSQQKHKANLILESQKQEIENTLTELKNTQTQLIQSEKMASLGELTAGIAHEIQNPLNFVNNFSEVNTELIEELKVELRAGHSENALAIADDIKDNEQKINLHGKRADSIVKGMLQHSRSSTAEKEPTGINALVDECLRLSYHGFRSKDKSINLTLNTEFDDRVDRIDIISQDIGRVFLNLFNNAFYSMAEKARSLRERSTDSQTAAYIPVLLVTTKRLRDCIEIRIRDNGNGVPQSALDKIFNPFFTTKPTGQGTGLGLSLSYDIVRKGHGGDVKVATLEGEFAEFIITLPAPLIPEATGKTHLS